MIKKESVNVVINYAQVVLVQHQLNVIHVLKALY